MDQMDQIELMEGADGITPAAPMTPAPDSEYFRHQEGLTRVDYAQHCRSMIKKYKFSKRFEISLCGVVDAHFDKTMVLANFNEIGAEISEIDLDIALEEALLAANRIDLNHKGYPVLKRLIKSEFRHFISRTVQNDDNLNERGMQGRYTILNEQKVSQILHNEDGKKRGWKFW